MGSKYTWCNNQEGSNMGSFGQDSAECSLGQCVVRLEGDASSLFGSCASPVFGAANLGMWLNCLLLSSFRVCGLPGFTDFVRTIWEGGWDCLSDLYRKLVKL